MEEAAFTSWATWETFESIYRQNYPNEYFSDYFIEHAKLDPNCTDSLGRTLLQVAVVRGREFHVDRLLNFPDIVVNLEICEIAAYFGHGPILRSLVLSDKKNFSIAQKDILGLYRYSVRNKRSLEGFAESFRPLTERLQPIVERLNVENPPLDPQIYAMAASHIIRNPNLPFSMLAKCVESSVRENLVDNVLTILDTIVSAEWDQDSLEYLTQTVFEMIEFILKSHQEIETQLAGKVTPIPWKNQLLFRATDCVQILEFLLTKCKCDPNVKNKLGSTVVHDILRKRKTLQLNQLPAVEIMALLHPGQIGIRIADPPISDSVNRCVYPMIEMFLSKGFHPCLSDSKGERIDRMLEKDFRDLYVKYCNRPLTLQCLAASKMMEVKINIPQDFRTAFCNFVLFHNPS